MPEPSARRLLAFRDAGELWMSDVMHGPKVRHGRSRRKTYLIAFIDDATRVVPFAAFATAENTQAFLPVFRNALIRRGLPQRLYVDNGASYRSRQLALVCARLGIALIHARPYLVYDGQQRLTTVSLILEALARHLKDDTAPDGFEPAQIRNDYLLNAVRKGDHQYLLLLKPGDSEIPCGSSRQRGAAA